MAVGVVVVFLLAWGGLTFLRYLTNFRRSLDLVFLRVLIPKKDSREDREKDQEQFGGNKDFQKITGLMVHLLQNMQSLFSGKLKNKILGQEFFSLEQAVLDGEIYFFIVVPRRFVYAVEKQVSSFYESAVVEVVEDYNIFLEGCKVTGTELVLTQSFAKPLQTFQSLQSETMNPILGALAKIPRTEGAAIQYMLRPVTGWQSVCENFASGLLNPGKKKGGGAWWNPFVWIVSVWQILVFGKLAGSSDAAGGKQVTQNVQDTAKLAADKAKHSGYDAIVRVVAAAPNQLKAESIVQALTASYRQFGAVGGNSLTTTTHHNVDALIRNFVFRSFVRSWASKLPMWLRNESKMILGAEEVASMYHFPHVRYNTMTGIKWQDFKIESAPPNLPKEGTLLGTNTFRGEKREVRIERNDRRRHFYVIGKSGTGKSTLLETMIKQDLANGEGVCVIDPHGDLVEAVLPFVPRKRADDVILFDPGDMERPMGLNILEGRTPDEREFMAQEALAIFIKMYGEEIMGPRLQNYFRNGCLTLMEDTEEGATLLDITRLFTDDVYQKYKSNKVTNPVVKSFWTKEMANSGQREKQEIIPYFSSKFGPFVTNGLIRNVIGQTKSAFNIRQVMDEKKILLCNLSKGKMGEINSQLLGSILVAKIQQAAMSRVDTPEEERADFYLYVDEFQNFVTDSFASILSEARKYRLNLCVAHQYISQITKMSGGGKGSHEDTTIRDAVFGNVGSMLCFKIGSADAETMAKEFAPVFSEQDLVNIANYRAYVKLNIKGTTSRGFTLETIHDQTGKDPAAAEAIRQLSRLKLGRDREFVETEIFKRVGA